MGMITNAWLFLAAPRLSVGEGGDVNIPKVDASQANLLTIMNTVYFWAGIIAVIVLVLAGFFYITSNGNAQQIERAKNTILYTVIGLVVIILAFIITQFVIGSVT